MIPGINPLSTRVAFTLIEVMIATAVLAVGITAALSAVFNNNNFRKSLDENVMADLVLRQMAARLKTTPMSRLGHVYVTPSNQAEGWTLHLRATASTFVPAATLSAPALAQPYSGTYAPPFRPLVQQELIDAGILRESVGLDSLAVYVEYYNLSAETGLQNVSGVLVPVENGLIKRYAELQVANPSGSPRLLWYTLVGNPLPTTPESPTDAQSNGFILPATYSVANVDQPGTPAQVRGAFNHGMAIRILISWRPDEVLNSSATYRRWRETVIVKLD